MTHDTTTHIYIYIYISRINRIKTTINLIERVPWSKIETDGYKILKAEF